MTVNPVIADLARTPLIGASGVVWGHEGVQLNANLVKLDAGESIDAHVNDEVEVVLIVSSGSGRVVINDVVSELSVDTVVSIPVGARRSIHARSRLLYFSVHQRRAPLAVDGSSATG